VPYSIETNHPDCEGFAVTKDDDGTLMGCHVSQDAANDQIAALYAAEADEETYSREVTLVWGPPCSGKSSFVRQNARRGDLILDRDSIHMALSNLDSHDRDSDVSSMVNRTFDELLRHVQDYPRSVWIIQSSPRKIDRSKFAHLVTRTEFIFADVDTCLERARNERPDEWQEFINRWFNNYEPDEELVEARAIDVPRFIQEQAARGLDYYSKGFGGDGLVERTIREARQMSRGSVPDSKPARMAAWFARHRGDLDSPRNSDENHEDFPGPGAVAWMLWGGNPTSEPMRAAKWAERQSQDERNYPVNYERRTTTGEGVEVRELEDGGMTAIGYASIFESTSQNLGGFVERVAPGAFKKTLQEADVRALFNHDQNQILGRVTAGTLRLQEDTKGLRYEIDLPNTQLGRDLAELLRRGDINGSSFGFRTIEDDWGETRDGYPLRTLRSVQLIDVSPVTFPAYLAAEASLRTLAEARNLDLDDLIEASENNTIKELLEDKESDQEPSETHSQGLPPSSFIR
jgi:HK97 family phage prohead protease